MNNTARISSIDLLRGIVMVIMAIDHTREFFGASAIRPEDLSQASAGLFLTRFVTHICAPTFIFLSGISIYLRQTKYPDGIRGFVCKRGLWLIAVELLVMGPIVTHGYNLIIFGILWVIGISMVILSAVMNLPRWLLLLFSLFMISAHHLLPSVPPQDFVDTISGFAYHTPFFIPVQPGILVAYTIIPWLGVMLVGYYVGPWFLLKTEDRSLRLLTSGIVLLLIFVALRWTNIYGDPLPWEVQPRGNIYTILSFINLNKYPASFLFLALMLGVAMVLLAVLERSRGAWTEVFLTFGQVPFFFFILHFLIISVSSAIWSSLVLGKYVNFAVSSPAEWPRTYEPSLLRIYIVWMAVILLCYFPSRWFGLYRRRHQFAFLSYL